jgi:hypothetical protein
MLEAAEQERSVVIRLAVTRALFASDRLGCSAYGKSTTDQVLRIKQYLKK